MNISMNVHNCTGFEEVRTDKHNANAVTFTVRARDPLTGEEEWSGLNLTLFGLPTEITDILVPALKAAEAAGSPVEDTA